jgi:hypothetical protein
MGMFLLQTGSLGLTQLTRRVCVMMDEWMRGHYNNVLIYKHIYSMGIINWEHAAIVDVLSRRGGDHRLRRFSL